jgi:mono/diheme cytochrome c family protein
VISAASLLFVSALACAQNPTAGTDLVSNPVFEKNCAKCHGKTAEGRHFAGPSLVTEKTRTTSADELRNVIANGRHRMPKFADKLTAAEIDVLVEQLRSVPKR